MSQLRAAGLTRGELRTRLQAGAWLRELPGVFRLQRIPGSWLQRIWSASLWAGPEALLSHRTAAWLYGLYGVGPCCVELSAPHELRPPVPWLVAHRSRQLPRSVRRMRQGLPVTSPPRTLVDLAAVIPRETVQECIEHALRKRLVTLNELEQVLAMMPSRGQAGPAKVSRFLALDALRPETHSELERRVLRLVRQANLPTPECQYLIVEDERLIATVDFAWPQAKLVAEAEGFEFHSSRRAWDRDLARYNQLTLSGWRVIRLTWTDVQRGLPEVMGHLSRLLQPRALRKIGRKSAPTGREEA